MAKELTEKEITELRTRIETKITELEKKFSNPKNLTLAEGLGCILVACQIIKRENIQDDELNLSIIHNLATYANRTISQPT